jgi:TRAP transporter TAXI family solute receptor
MAAKRNTIVLVSAMCLCALVLVVGTVKQAAAYDIRWGTSPAGGSWQPLGTAMLEDVLKVDPKLQGSTMPIGGAANVIAVQQGKLNVAFSFSDSAGEAWEGKEFFKKEGELRNIRELAVLFPEPTQIAVMADSGINDIKQLKGKSVTPGPKGSAIAVVSRFIFEAYGMSFDDMNIRFLSFAEAGDQFVDRHLDCIFYGAMAYPAPPLVSASSQRQIKLLSLSDEVISKLVKEYKGIMPYTLSKDSYKGVDYPVKGIAANTIVIVNKDMPDDVAYTIVKSIYQNFSKYGEVVKAMALGKREEMAQDIGIPFHPGAAKFYKEKGLMK